WTGLVRSWLQCQVNDRRANYRTNRCDPKQNGYSPLRHEIHDFCVSGFASADQYLQPVACLDLPVRTTEFALKCHCLSIHSSVPDNRMLGRISFACVMLFNLNDLA